MSGGSGSLPERAPVGPSPNDLGTLIVRVCSERGRRRPGHAPPRQTRVDGPDLEDGEVVGVRAVVSGHVVASIPRTSSLQVGPLHISPVFRWRGMSGLPRRVLHRGRPRGLQGGAQGGGTPVPGEVVGTKVTVPRTDDIRCACGTSASSTTTPDSRTVSFHSCLRHRYRPDRGVARETSDRDGP